VSAVTKDRVPERETFLEQNSDYSLLKNKYIFSLDAHGITRFLGFVHFSMFLRP
jgi:hypothetical protein